MNFFRIFYPKRVRIGPSTKEFFLLIIERQSHNIFELYTNACHLSPHARYSKVIASNLPLQNIFSIDFLNGIIVNIMQLSEFLRQSHLNLSKHVPKVVSSNLVAVIFHQFFIYHFFLNFNINSFFFFSLQVSIVFIFSLQLILQLILKVHDKYFTYKNNLFNRFKSLAQSTNIVRRQ